MPDNDYGIVCNVLETDRVFRKGAKAWMAHGAGGEGFHRFQFIALSRGGRAVQKWAPTNRFTNFRAAWIPPNLSDKIIGHPYGRGTKEEMVKLAERLNAFVTPRGDIQSTNN